MGSWYLILKADFDVFKVFRYFFPPHFTYQTMELQQFKLTYQAMAHHVSHKFVSCLFV